MDNLVRDSTRWRGRLREGLLIAGVFFVGLGAASAASNSAEELAKRLVKLRGEVEQLAADIEVEKQDTRSTLRTLASQRTDLELQLQREELRLKKLRQAYDKYTASIAQADERQKRIKPAMGQAIEEIRGAIKRGLPFKRAERLAELSKIETSLDKGEIASHQAANRLWQLVEDELRLARENGLYKQTITLDGEEVLSEVARLGMVTMFFKTPDGRVGRIQGQSGAYTYEVTTSEKDVEQIKALFDAFQKQIRVGYFELPNTLPVAGGAK